MRVNETGCRPKSVVIVRVLGEWKTDTEDGSAVGLILRPDAAVMMLNDGARDGQPHAHALVLGRKERLKQLRSSLSCEMPWPLSAIEISAAPSIRAVRVVTLRSGPSVLTVASMPFTIRFRITC